MRVADLQIEASIRRLGQRISGMRQDMRKPAESASQARMIRRSQFAAPEGAKPSRVDLERILGTNDLLDVNYFERGLKAARSVGRIVFLGVGNRETGYATGFMVSPRLMLTNHHVFGDKRDAVDAVVEFGYELDTVGQLRRPERFRFAPDEYFFAVKELDFALVAVDPAPQFDNRPLAQFGWLPLYQTLGKVNEGEFVSIIQHPGGQPKQLAVRENKLIKIEDSPPMLVYLSDTAPGSSGSPVLNDSWQVVGLHHSGVPKRDSAGRWIGRNGQVLPENPPEEDVVWLANEGIRISAIIKTVLEDGPHRPLRDDFEANLGKESAVADIGRTAAGGTSRDGGPVMRPDGDGMLVTVPLSFRVQWTGAQLSAPAASGATRPGPAAVSTQPRVDGSTDAVDEVKIIDKDFSAREALGYDPEFLGVKVPMPTLTPKGKETVAKRTDGVTAALHSLPYYHYSVVMNRDRRLCFFTASNYNAEKSKRGELSRKVLGKDKWDPDPRLALTDQVLKHEIYDGTDFDLGHIVRREDNYWGDSEEEAQFANWDTFFYTNCTPQHSGFNQSASKLGGIWGDLENFVAKQMKQQDGLACQFAGPVFSSTDPEMGKNRIKVPKQYWKVIVVLDDSSGPRKLKAFGFLLSQKDLIKDKEASFIVDEPFTPYHVSLARIEKLTEVRFPAVVRDADVKKPVTAKVKTKGKGKKPAPVVDEAVLLTAEALTIETGERASAGPILAPSGNEMERAVLLAEASRAAYGDGQAAGVWTSTHGFAAPELFDLGNIQGFWTVGADEAVLCFRGTSNIRQWIIDARFITADHPWGRVHSGFIGGLAAVESMLGRFATASQGKKHCWITGHSLGGAMAVLSAVWLKMTKNRAVSAVTFGQPLVGLAGFAKRFNEELPDRLTRYVNQSDIVARVPPIPYVHCGKGRVIERPGVIGSEATFAPAAVLLESSGTALTKNEFEALRASLARTGPVAAGVEEKLPGWLVPDIFAHHYIENYVTELKRLRDAGF